MWSNLSAIAEKAREAAAMIDQQMNDAMASNSDDDDEEATKWDTCDKDDSTNKKSSSIAPAPNSGMSFVDLKAEADNIPKAGSSCVDLNAEDIPDTVEDTELVAARAKIQSLEKQVNALKDELAAAREESQNNHARNIYLEKQIELKDEKNH
jgi:hypothetical protein